MGRSRGECKDDRRGRGFVDIYATAFACVANAAPFCRNPCRSHFLVQTALALDAEKARFLRAHIRSERTGSVGVADRDVTLVP